MKLQRTDTKFTDPNVIWRHGLQVVLKRLPPFDGWLELVHFDKVICIQQNKRKTMRGHELECPKKGTNSGSNNETKDQT